MKLQVGDRFTTATIWEFIENKQEWQLQSCSSSYGNGKLDYNSCRCGCARLKIKIRKSRTFLILFGGDFE